MSLTDRTRRVVAVTPSRALRLLPSTAMVLDLVMVGLGGVIGSVLRVHTPLASSFDTDKAMGWPALLLVVGWLGSIAALGGYDRGVFGAGPEEFKRIARATWLTAAVVGVGCYLAKYPLSRGYFVLALVAGLALVLVGRFALRKLLHGAHRRGFLLARVLIAGTPSHVDEIASVLNGSPWLGYGVAGAVVADPASVAAGETTTGVPVVGRIDDLVPLAVELGVDTIFLGAGEYASGERLRTLVWDLEEHDVDLVVAPGLSEVSSQRVAVRPIGGLPLLHLGRPTWSKATRIGKRTFDVVGSAALILGLAPMFVVAAVAIRVADRGPVLYRQERVGRRGRTFSCLKFRTMVVGADAMVAQLQEESEQDALLFKLREDPRITAPGRSLRRYSIDELPQLFNVLRGDMSLVGPRPQVQEEVDLYDGGMARRLLVRPGMTGLWQVSGRSDLSPEEARRLDLFYVDNWSMLQDLAILARTFGAVVGSRGAY